MDDKIRKSLEAPFDKSLIKERTGPNGMRLSYVGISSYIARLNSAFSGEWSLELTRREIIDDQIVVEVRLTAGGVTKTGLGGATVTRRRETGVPVALGDDLKRAESDAIKRACRLYGLGLHLRGIEIDDSESEEESVDSVPPVSARSGAREAPSPRSIRQTPQPPSGPTRLTARQLNAIWAIARSQGYSDTEFRSYCVETFHAQPEYLSRASASEIIAALGKNGNGHSDHRPGEAA